VALVLAVAFVTLPGVYRPLGPPGIDPGWEWAINQARQAGLVFGRDVVFTYGPLGFLMAPLDIGHNLLIANLFFVLAQLLFGAALALLFVERSRLAAAFVFALLFVCARHLGLALEAQLLLTVGALVLLSLVKGVRTPLAAAAGLAGVLLLVKMSLGVASVMMLSVAAAVSVLLYRRPVRELIGLLAFPAVVAVLAAFCFDRPETFFSWLRLSLEVVAGYSVANSILGPPAQVALGVAAVAGWFASAVALRRERDLLAWSLVLAPVVLVQFRLAFVRQDTHQLQFVPFVLAAVALSALLARRRLHLAAHAAAFGLLLAGGGLTGLVDPVGRGLLPRNLATGGWGTRALAKLWHLDATRQSLAAESRANLAELELPEQWLELIRGSEGGVGTLPWEIQYCPANDLEWSPTPTLQLYSAYTAVLDSWSAERYAGDQAPEFIVNEYVPVGKRHQVIDAPATWRQVFIRYRLRAYMLEPTQVALLQRRAETPDTSYELVGHGTVALGGPAVAVPRVDGLLFAELDLRLSLLGRLQKTLFRVPLIYLVLFHESGDSTAYRLTPGPAVNGVLVNRFPKDFMGYRRLFQGVVDDPVVRVMITGPGTAFFRSPVSITWRELRFVGPTPPSPPGPDRS
jgi:hypothetical protein